MWSIPLSCRPASRRSARLTRPLRRMSRLWRRTMSSLPSFWRLVYYVLWLFCPLSCWRGVRRRHIPLYALAQAHKLCPGADKDVVCMSKENDRSENTWDDQDESEMPRGFREAYLDSIS